MTKALANKRGFSLIELSIVLVISGIMLYGTISVYAVSAEKSKLDNTNAKLDAIVQALRLHYQTLGDLPCPASGTLALTDNNFGLGAESLEGTCTYNTMSLTGASGGVVPTRTLNLPDNYMFDAWGNRITYVVDADCDNKDAGEWDKCSDLINFPVTAASITVQDNSGNSVRTANAAYVLISHGKNGAGAYDRGGNKKANSSSANEAENSDAENPVIFKDDFIRDWTGATDYYDDMVRWKLPAQISYVD